MTLGEIKYTAYVKLTGGRPSNDSALWNTDLEPYVLQAVNKVNRDHYLEGVKLQGGDTQIEQHLIQVTPFPGVPIVYDDNRQRYYSTLPWRLSALPKGRALEFVGNQAGNAYIPGQQGEQDMEEYYSKFKIGQTTYYLEGPIILYYNLPEVGLPTHAMMRALVAIDSFSDDDQVMIAAGKELLVIDLVVQYFTEQRQIPADNEIDGSDITSTKPIAS
jgi:hypothetical protein